LQDYILKLALERGIDRVNSFAIDGVFEGNKLLEFKAGFGGEVEEYIGKFTKVLRPAKMRIVTAQRKVLGIVRRMT